MTEAALSDGGSIRLLERLAAAAWPASENERLGGWVCRSDPDVTRRANSVWPREWEASGPTLASAIEDVCLFYRERGKPARFQIGPGSQPEELESRLAAAGFVIEAPVALLVADADLVISRTPDRDDVIESPVPGDSWLRAYLPTSWQSPLGQARAALVERIADSRLCVHLAEAGQPTACGLGVVADGWMGISAMHTIAETRRRGLARAILGHLARRAVALGVSRLYLHVERDNAAAARLYERVGFAAVSGYHYRTRGLSEDRP